MIFHITLAIFFNSAPADFGDKFSEYRIVQDPLELTILMSHSRISFNEDWPVERFARSATGIHLVPDVLNDVSTIVGEKRRRPSLEKMIRDDIIPDIVGASDIKKYANEYGPQGAFVGLSDLINQYAPNIKSHLNKNPNIRSAIQASNGEIYYIPYIPDGKYARGYFIRQDWLLNLNLEIPNDVHELEATLIAFKNKDPNGNGKMDEIPFFARQWPELLRLITLWGGRSSGSDRYHDFYIDGDIIKHPYSDEEYKTGISNLARWYSLGLIDPDIFSRGSLARQELLSENLGGMTHDWFPSTSLYNDRLKEEIPGFLFKAFIPPKSISGRRLAENRRGVFKADGWAIGHGNQHIVETIKYFDYWFSEEGRRLANFGVQGEQYNLVDGEAQFTNEILTNGRAVNQQLYEVGAQISARGFHQDQKYETQWSNKHALEGFALYDEGNYLVEQFLGVALNVVEQAVFDRYWSSILEYMLEQQKSWILGKRNILEDWDKYIETLNFMGFERVVEVVNAAYKRQYQ